MAYSESTSVANRTAFITAVINFAVANAGFANQGTTIDGAYTIYHISKGGVYWNFLVDEYAQSGPTPVYVINSRMSFAKITTRSSFNSEGTPAGQQIRTQTTFYNSTGPYVKYFLYTDGVAVHCIAQIYSSVFTHLSFGNITKFGSYTGGEYVTGNGSSYPSGANWLYFSHYLQALYFDAGVGTTAGGREETGYIRHVIGIPANDKEDFARMGGNTENNQRCNCGISSGVLSTLVETCGVNSFNLRAPLYSMPVQILDPITSRYILIGEVPYIRVVNCKNIAPATIVENDWIVFPITQRSTGGDDSLSALSGEWGVAYKRVA